MRVNRRDEMVAIAEALEQLALEIREAVGEPAAASAAAPAEGKTPLRAGLRVRVTIADRYKGQVGTIVDQRGTHYWNVRLDALDGGVERVIYKKETSLVVIDGN